MAPKKKKKPTAAQSKKAKTEERIAKLVSAAKEKRAEAKSLLRELREDPGMADEVKEMLCADLVRVSEIPRELLGPSSARDRYRQLGHFSTSLVDFIYGLWAEFQRSAGLAETLHTRAVKRNISKTSRAQDLADYADEHVKPWDGAYAKLNMRKRKLEFLTGSDFHSALCNPFAMRVFQDINKGYRPDGVRLNGDIVDFPQLSTHRQFPGHFPMTVQDEINWAKFQLFGPLRENNPGADIKFIMGNHDVRLVTALADKGPMFGSLDSMSFAGNFRLDDYEIGLVCRSNFLHLTSRQRANDIAQNWETLLAPDGRMLFTWVHGFLCGLDAPRKHAVRFMTNGSNGHLHSRQEISVGSYATGVVDWHQTPCMAHPRAIAAGYIPGPVEATGWSCGALYTTIDVPTGHVHNEAIRVGDDIATFRDRVWKITQRERDLIEQMMEI